MNDIKTLPSRPQHARPFLSMPATVTGGDASRWIRDTAMHAILVSRPSSPATLVQRTLTLKSEASSIAEQLYNARAACKIKTAAVAMHLDAEWRIRFFAQVDSLLDADEWDSDDKPPTEASFTTLLRMILLIRSKRRPGLGATSDGNVIAAWTAGKDRLTVECMPADEVRWVLVRYLDGERETAAGQTTLPRLLEVLRPYDPQHWFADEGSKAPA